MQCPHCRHEFDTKPHTFSLGIDRDGTWQVASTRCPSCERLIVNLCTDQDCTYPAWPATLTRPWLCPEVPEEFAAEYHTAAQVIHYSPEASAAISRRLLHRFLADYLDAGDDGLAEQIDTVVSFTCLPVYLKEALATLSQVARLDQRAAKSAHPEALSGVEPGEAEWLLDVLEPLFELQFVQPARMQRKVALLEEQIGPLTPPPREHVESLEETPAPAVGEEASLSADGDVVEPPAADDAGDGSTVDTDSDNPRQVDAGEADATEAEAPRPQDSDGSVPGPDTGVSPQEAERGGWRRKSGR